MDQHDVDRIERVAKAAAELTITLAFAPLRLLLRVMQPAQPARPAQRVEPEEPPAPADEPLAPVEPIEPVEAVPPSPHATDLTGAQAARLREAAREEEATPDSPGPELHVDSPWEGYDAMNVADVLARLRGADEATLAMVRLYEETHRNRRGILRATGGE